MTRVVWTAEAIGDLDAVRVYIERDSPNYANVVCADIVSAVRRLKSFPESGERVEVLTVFHGARFLRLEVFGEVP